MTIAPNTQAVLLLTSRFSKSGSNSVKPLTPKEWGRFAAWLRDHDLTPRQLMNCHPQELLRMDGSKNNTGSAGSIAQSRFGAREAMEKWLRAGLWVIARSDTAYPSRLKKLLGTQSPAILFGCGNQSLLDGGLAVVAIAMEKWLRAGLWVIARSDTAYPSTGLKKLLGTQSPAILFGGGCGINHCSKTERRSGGPGRCGFEERTR